MFTRSVNGSLRKNKEAERERGKEREREREGGGRGEGGVACRPIAAASKKGALLSWTDAYVNIPFQIQEMRSPDVQSSDSISRHMRITKRRITRDVETSP
jgi:hypothetical protein